MRILMIEDDPSTAESIELILRKADLNTYVTDSGEEGIELAKLYDYDLILLDLSLPDMDGYDVLRKLRMARIATPTLILTGLDGIDNKIKGFSVGADDYLTKPFNREELIARIHAMRNFPDTPSATKNSRTGSLDLPVTASEACV